MLRSLPSCPAVSAGPRQLVTVPSILGLTLLRSHRSQSGDRHQWVTRSFSSIISRGLEGVEPLLLTEHYYLKFLSIFHGPDEEGKSLRMVSLVFCSTAYHGKSEFYFLHRDPTPNSENCCTSLFGGLGHLFIIRKVMDVKVK